MSTSTRESEIVAMSVGLREALNVVDLWETMFHKLRRKKSTREGGPRSGGIGARAPMLEVDHEVPLLAYEDNEATICEWEKGSSKAVGHTTELTHTGFWKTSR